MRSRLGTSILTDLAEVKMHIRDENLRRDNAKERLKRHFGPPKPTNGVYIIDVMPLQVTDIYVASIVTTGPVSTPSQHEPGTQAPSDELDTDTSPLGDPPSGDRRAFRSLVDHFSDLLDQDDDDDWELQRGAIATGGAELSKIEIQDLFDFDSKHWTGIYSETARRSFDEELAVYELLDLDAEGDIDVDLDVDGITGDTLIGGARPDPATTR